MSAQDKEGGGPASGEALADATKGPPSEPGQAADVPKVLGSHGENATSAYVAAIPVPKRQRLKTVDMSKVRISSEMKVEIADPRHMPTTKMEIPPGGIRPPPPPANMEGAAPGASPWSTSSGIDRSMLPSASLGPSATPSTVRPPPPATTDDDEGRGIGLWIGVVVIAALLGGGAAYLLRAKPISGGTVSSSAPIAVGVPGKTPTPVATPTSSESEPTGDEPMDVETDAGLGQGGAGATGGPRVFVPRKTTTKTTGTGTAAPTSTGTGPKRLFD